MTSLDSASKDWGDREVVITGVGMVTPIGVSTMETWRALCAGDNGIGPLLGLMRLHSLFVLQLSAEK